MRGSGQVFTMIKNSGWQVLLVAASWCWLLTFPARADEPIIFELPVEPAVTPVASIWEVNCRSLACLDIPNELAAIQLCDNQWRCRSEADLFSEILTQPARNIIYIHGNRTSPAEARQKVMRLACALGRRADGLPLRVILFSWPSEKPDVILPRKMVEEKKSAIEGASIQLASLLMRIPTGDDLGIVGFSFGCAVACGALHLQAGGDISGYMLCERQDTLSKSARVGFIAPAFERDALLPNGRLGKSMERIEVLVNLYNSQDPILRRFRFFDRAKPDAAGLVGLVGSQQKSGKTTPLSASDGLFQFDCQNVGRSHAEIDYYSCNRLYVMLDAVLGKDLQTCGLTAAK
jgi:hypothetical protein